MSLPSYGGGEEGVRLYIEKLAGELADAMLMCGARTLADITPEMSASASKTVAGPPGWKNLEQKRQPFAAAAFCCVPFYFKVPSRTWP